MSEIIAGTFLLIGSAFLFLAGVAVLRFPDLFTRLSATGKATSLGAGVMFLAVGAYFPEIGVLTRSIAGALFFLSTSPVSAHAIARTGYHIGMPFFRNTINLPPPVEHHEDVLGEVH